MTENLEEIQFEVLEFIIVKVVYFGLENYTPFTRTVFTNDKG